MSARLGRFTAELDSGRKQLDAFAQHAESTATAASRSLAAAGPAGGLALPGGGAGAEAAPAPLADLGGQLRAATAGMAEPLRAMAARFEAAFDRVGGTVVALARRIDGALKFNATSAALNRLEAQFTGTFAGMAISATRNLSRVKAFFSSFGDVAGRGLSQMKGMNLATPVASVAKLVPGFKAADAAARATTGTVRHLGVELAAALGVFGLAYKAVDFFKGAIKGASDLQESTNKAKAVFGSAYGTIAADTDGLAAKFGLVKSTMTDAKANFGQLAQQIGMSEQKSGEFANTFTKLAADLTSFQNIPMDQSLLKLQAALAGEVEPLARLGVNVRENAVKQYALAAGIAKVGEEMSDQQKVMARAGLIQRQLSVVSGDLDRTIGDYANASRAAEGRLENLSATIGTALLPALNAFKGLINEVLIDFTASHSGMQSGLEAFAGHLKATFEGIGVIYRNWGDMVQITSLSVQEKLLNVGELFGWLRGAAGTVAAWFANDWRNILADAFRGVWTAAENVFNNIKGLWQATVDFFANPSGGFHFTFTPLLDGFGEAMSTLPEIARPHLTSLQKEMDAVGARVADREAERAAGMQGATATQVQKAAALPDAAGKKKKDGPQFAAALELGSQEARSAVLKASLGQPGGDGIKDVAKSNREQVTHQKSMAETLKQIAANTRAVNAAGLGLTAAF